MGMTKYVLSVVVTVLKSVGRFCVAWMRFVTTVTLLFWHFGS